MRNQHFTHPEFGQVTFIDRRELHYSRICEPRDIELRGKFSARERTKIREAITLDIREAQGVPTIGRAKAMKWE